MGKQNAVLEPQDFGGCQIGTKMNLELNLNLRIL